MKTTRIHRALLACTAAIMPVIAAAQTLNIPNVPLFLGTSASPNIMLMLDTSGSMTNIVPDRPFDPAVTYTADPTPAAPTAVCPAANLPPPGQVIDLRVQVSGTANGSDRGPSVFYNGRNYAFGIGPGQVCFAPTAMYNAHLVTLGGPEGDYLRQSDNEYLSAPYPGNFLNWYFNRNNTPQVWNENFPRKPLSASAVAQERIEVARAAGSSLVQSLDSRLRVGLSSYNSNDGGRLNEVVGDLTSAKRTSLSNSINSLTPGGQTPLAETLSDIGKYFATGNNTGNLTINPAGVQRQVSVDYLFNNPNEHSGLQNAGNMPPVTLSCQRNFAVLLTDGRPQGDRTVSEPFRDYDGDCAAGVRSAQGLAACGDFDEKPERTYEGVGSDYLDDVAQALHDIDLRPDFPAEGDGSQFKNNITTYMIGFADASVVNDPLVRNAAIQGGGAFYPAGDSGALAASFSNIISSILQTIGDASSVTTNSTSLNSDTRVFQALFNSGDWSGTLRAFQVSTGARDGSPCPGTPIGNLCRLYNDPNRPDMPEWSSATQLAATLPGDRTILTYKPSTHAGAAFTWNNLDDGQKALLSYGPGNIADGRGGARLNYLRGDATDELTGIFRSRGLLAGDATSRNKQGDIVNSDPFFVGAPPFSYGFGGYTTFRSNNARRTPMVYVGGNDGMLHGFRADGGATAGGRELIAYVPGRAYGSTTKPTLARLTQAPYVHQFVVDGSPTVGDVQIGTHLPPDNGTAADWRSLLVGTMRSGGQGVFALNVTDPSTFSEANAASLVRWEFTDANDPDLGYTFSQPAIVKLANGKWAAIIGNGYNNTEVDGAASSSGAAALFILFTDGPGANGVWTPNTHYVKLTVPGGSATAPNGLATAAPVDLDGDGIVDYVYAGDLRGNLWRFDLTAATPSSWTVAYNMTPVYVAMDAGNVRQPITVRPEVGLNPNTTKANDVIVYFGTGRYIDGSDNLTDGQQTQTFYGIFDDKDATTPLAASGRSGLLQQRVAFETRVNNGAVRVTTQRTFSTPLAQNGWYIDLFNTNGNDAATGPNLGERQVTAPVLRNGRIVFTTLQPSTSLCTPGGGGFLMELDARTGSRPTPPALDIDHNGVVDAADVVTGTVNGETGTQFGASGVGSNVGILTRPAILSVDNAKEKKYLGGSKGGIDPITERAGGRLGRITWRELSPP